MRICLACGQGDWRVRQSRPGRVGQILLEDEYWHFGTGSAIARAVVRLRKVSLAFEVGRCPDIVFLLAVVPHRLVAEEPEAAILAVVHLRNVYRAAEIDAAAPVAHQPFRIGDVGIGGGVQFIVLTKRKECAVKLVGAGLGGHVDDATADLAILGAVRVHQDGNLLNRVGTEGNRNPAKENGAVRNAVGLVLSGAHLATGDRHAGSRRNVAGIHAGLFAAGISDDARNGIQDVEHVRIRKRQIFNLSAVNAVLDSAAGLLDQRRLSRNRDRGRGVANRHLQVDGSGVVRLNRDWFANQLFEACDFSRQPVGARLQGRN